MTCSRIPTHRDPAGKPCRREECLRGDYQGPFLVRTHQWGPVGTHPGTILGGFSGRPAGLCPLSSNGLLNMSNAKDSHHHHICLHNHCLLHQHHHHLHHHRRHCHLHHHHPPGTILGGFAGALLGYVHSLPLFPHQCTMGWLWSMQYSGVKSNTNRSKNPYIYSHNKNIS